MARVGCAVGLAAALLVGSAASGAATTTASGAATTDATTDGRGWGKPEVIKEDAKPDDYGPVLSMPDGSTLAFWTIRNGHLVVSERPAGGAWSPQDDLTGAGSNEWAHDVIKDRHNGATLFWRGTIGDQQGIWSRRYVDQEWKPQRLELALEETHFGELSVAKTRSATVVQWREGDAGRGVIRVAVQHGSAEWTILPSLPSSDQWVDHVAIDRAGLPTIAGAEPGELLVTTYGPDGTWVEEQIGPNPGYELLRPDFPNLEGASNRDGTLVVGWREIATGAEGAVDAPASAKTVARVRPSGQTFGPVHTLTDESGSDCFTRDTCLTLGMAADGDVTAVYASLPDDLTDLWLSHRDAATGEWNSPDRLASDLNPYAADWAHSTARSGRSVVAVEKGDDHLVYRCKRNGDCGSPDVLKPPSKYDDVVVDSAGKGAALLWAGGCAPPECEFDRNLLARVFE